MISFLRSPLYRLIENVSVGGVLGGECVAAILHAEHHKGLGAVIAYAAASGGSHAHYGAFLDRKNLAVNLKLSFTREEEVDFLMILMGMKESGFLTRSEYLE